MDPRVEMCHRGYGCSNAVTISVQSFPAMGNVIIKQWMPWFRRQAGAH